MIGFSLGAPHAWMGPKRTQAKPHSHMGPAKPIHHSRDARLRRNLVFVNATACDPARAPRACMNYKNPAENRRRK